MTIDPARAEALFRAAITRADPAERRAFLDRKVGADNELRARIDALLAAYDRPPGVPDRPLDADLQATVNMPVVTVDLAPGTTEPGRSQSDETTGGGRRRVAGPARVDTVIAGRYKLRQEIGEGGMGTVFLADQARPVKRQVALKLIKPGMDSRAVLARFEAERQALAIMDHPHIAKVLDAGATEDGRPFFVMELVKGIPLTDYCDQHRLGLPERLDLFRQICSAVQHAHQKGIIHRDLKPGNILVESHDGKPVPKVIDFGLAKATDGLQLTDHSAYTGFGGMAGTPLYMAPEQASFNAMDVDTRADIYALGVILYELLTGSTPIIRERMKRAALDEMLRLIREDEPATPSSRIGQSDTLPGIAASRQTEPARLSRFVRGDLDWIVMKALAKERGRRYESAIAFAQDIERFTNHEPVVAGPPTASYRLRKFVRRNRGKVIAASLVLIALLAGIAGTTIGLLEARKQRGIAVAAAFREKDAREAETIQRQEAIRRLTMVEKSNEILGSMFKDLDPMGDQGDGRPLGVILGERLDQAAARIDVESVGDATAVARLLRPLAEAQIGLGHHAKGIALYAKIRDDLTAVFGPDSPEALRSMADHANAEVTSGSKAQGVSLLERTLQRMEAKLGPEHPDTLRTMSKLALAYLNARRRDLAAALCERAVTLMEAKLGPGDPDTIETMMIYGVHLAPSDKAKGILERTLVLAQAHLGKDHNTTLAAMRWLAPHYGRTDLAKTIGMFEASLELGAARYGRDHVNTLYSMLTVASAYRQLGQADRALRLDEERYRLFRAKFGGDHPDPQGLGSSHALIEAYKAAGQPEKALALLEEEYARKSAKLGPEDPKLDEDMKRLATEYVALGKPERAKALAYRHAGFREGDDAKGSRPYARAMVGLAAAYRDNGKPSDAESYLREALAILDAKELGSALTFAVRSRLGEALLHQYKFAEAEPLLWSGYEGLNKLGEFRENGMDPNRESVDRLLLLGDWTYKPVGPPARGLPVYEGAFTRTKLMKGTRYPEDPDILLALRRLAGAYIAFGRADKARAVIWEHAGIRTGTQDRDSLGYARASKWLGEAYLWIQRWADAEKPMREALTILQAREPDAWTTFDAESMLGWAMLYQGKYAEAEPHLRAGYEGLRYRAATIPIAERYRVGKAVDRLIAMAEAQKKPDAVAAWKAEKAKPLDTTPKPPTGKP